MTEKRTFFLRQSAVSIPHTVREDVVLEIMEHGIHLLFAVPEPADSRYTQERFIYSWEGSKFTLLPGNLLVISGTPEETIDSIPLVITQGGRRCMLVDRSAFIVVIRLSEESAQAVKDVLRQHGG